MKRTKRQKGFILLMVVALIPLLGMASVVLTSNSRLILANTRRAALKTHAQLACESGIAWIKQNARNSVTKDQSLVLEIDHKEKKISCTIELISQAGEQSTFTVTGCAEDKRFSYKYPQQFVLKH
ncbi:MAG: hypothetical protein ABFR90_09910 [Planctomycetota bacterium]